MADQTTIPTATTVPTVYLVSGATRGIGLGLVTQLASEPKTIVFAGARNPGNAHALLALTAKHTNVHILPLVSANRANNVAAISSIEHIAGRLDVMIANAGICAYFGPAVETPEAVVMEHIRVNTLGPLIFFQAAWPLLQRSPNPKFALISSGAGSITSGAPLPVPMLAYGLSKSAANYLLRKLQYEHPALTCVVLSPGAVDTDMARFARQEEGAMRAVQLVSVEESVRGCLKRIEEATREEGGPKMMNYDGAVWEW
ncbi:NAD(P)-binding protein [Calocera cornea HHB12733]|uniref:NAD(P)-binding protein n=1 Tax=Calocera cornea HHB12733 TaxID=1353952 RepID=A0A165E967_9BASI|nr:NAD(P)-binding protein [Calocera cornea HHB12733]